MIPKEPVQLVPIKPRWRGRRALSSEERERFSEWRRTRMRVPRTLLFVILGLAYAIAPTHNRSFFGAGEDLEPVLLLLELGLVVPACALAALVSWIKAPQVLTRALQSAAVLVVVGVTLALRYLALTTDMTYPTQMAGIVLIAIAMFGGFAWARIVLTSLAYLGLSVTMELAYVPDGSSAVLETYSALYMGLIAIAGTITHEMMMRYAWWELNRVKQARAALRFSESRFNAFMDNSPIIAWIKDGDRRYVYRNQGHKNRYGPPGEDWSGRRDEDFFPSTEAGVYENSDGRVLQTGDVINFETANINRAGQTEHWWIHKFPLQDEAGRKLVGGLGVDLGERRVLEQMLRESEARFRLQALTDELTGCYNRRGLTLLAEQELTLARRAGLRCALFFVDLDGLKRINLEHGHAGGDAAIVAVGEALRVAVRDSDVVGRVGGDEYVVFAADCEDPEDLKRRIIETVASYGHSASVPFALSASVGLREFDASKGETLEQLMLDADQKMYAAKQQRPTP